ncbi:hypothetical protein HK405_011774, partial [Cladochytrium tenue]
MTPTTWATSRLAPQAALRLPGRRSVAARTWALPPHPFVPRVAALLVVPARWLSSPASLHQPQVTAAIGSDNSNGGQSAGKQSSRKQPAADPLSTPNPRHLPSDRHPAFPEHPVVTDSMWRTVSLAASIAVVAFTFAVAVHNEAAGDDATAPGLPVMTVDADAMHLHAEVAERSVGVWVWGSNSRRVADPSVADDAVFRRPHFVEAFNGMELRDLKFAKTHAAAIDASGNLVQYGASLHELGNPADRRPLVTLRGKDLVQLAVTPSAVFALSRSGAVLRIPAAPPSSVVASAAPASPVAFASGAGSRSERIAAVAAGDHHLLALGASGRVYSCAVDAAGDRWGQLGHASTINLAADDGGAALDNDSDLLLLRPVTAGGLGAVRIAQVAAGSCFSVARSESGDVYAWGANHLGQLGLGSFTSMSESAAFSSPQLVKSLWSRTRAVERPPGSRCSNVVAAGDTVYYVVDHPDSTEVFAAGLGLSGQLGNSGYQHVAHRPVRIAALSNLQAYSESARRVLPIRVKDLVASPTHAVAILDAASPSPASGRPLGDVVAWGLNDRGQLARADGRRANAPAPVWVAPLALPPAAAAAGRVDADADGDSGAGANEDVEDNVVVVARPRRSVWDTIRRAYRLPWTPAPADDDAAEVTVKAPAWDAA